MIKRGLLLSLLLVFVAAATAQAGVITFTGGTAYLSGGGTATPNNSGIWQDSVDYYVEGGMKYDFINFYGTIGNYYAIGSRPAGVPAPANDVVHAHWGNGTNTSMVISKVDGTAFDLNYVDITSNTTVGGDQATGLELSYITNNSGHSMLLPSSDWGFDYDYYGNVGDGVARLWLDSNFDGVTSVTLTSLNAYCFGMDNFYIDVEAPPQVPEPASLLLLGTGLVGLAHRISRKRRG